MTKYFFLHGCHNNTPSLNNNSGHLSVLYSRVFGAAIYTGFRLGGGGGDGGRGGRRETTVHS